MLAVRTLPKIECFITAQCFIRELNVWFVSAVCGRLVREVKVMFSERSSHPAVKKPHHLTPPLKTTTLITIQNTTITTIIINELDINKQNRPKWSRKFSCVLTAQSWSWTKSVLLGIVSYRRGMLAVREETHTERQRFRLCSSRVSTGLRVIMVSARVSGWCVVEVDL